MAPLLPLLCYDIMHMICKDLSSTDLKSLRSVSREASAVTSKVLFQTCKITFKPGSFKSFRKLVTQKPIRGAPHPGEECIRELQLVLVPASECDLNHEAHHHSTEVPDYFYLSSVLFRLKKLSSLTLCSDRPAGQIPCSVEYALHATRLRLFLRDLEFLPPTTTIQSICTDKTSFSRLSPQVFTLDTKDTVPIPHSVSCFLWNVRRLDLQLWVEPSAYASRRNHVSTPIGWFSRILPRIRGTIEHLSLDIEKRPFPESRLPRSYCVAHPMPSSPLISSPCFGWEIFQLNQHWSNLRTFRIKGIAPPSKRNEFVEFLEFHASQIQSIKFVGWCCTSADYLMIPHPEIIEQIASRLAEPDLTSEVNETHVNDLLSKISFAAEFSTSGYRCKDKPSMMTTRVWDIDLKTVRDLSQKEGLENKDIVERFARRVILEEFAPDRYNVVSLRRRAA